MEVGAGSGGVASDCLVGGETEREKEDKKAERWRRMTAASDLVGGPGLGSSFARFSGGRSAMTEGLYEYSKIKKALSWRGSVHVPTSTGSFHHRALALISIVLCRDQYFSLYSTTFASVLTRSSNAETGFDYAAVLF